MDIVVVRNNGINYIRASISVLDQRVVSEQSASDKRV